MRPCNDPLASKENANVRVDLEQKERTSRRGKKNRVGREAFMLLKDNPSILSDDAPPSRNTRSRRQRICEVELAIRDKAFDQDTVKDELANADTRSIYKTKTRVHIPIDENSKSGEAKISLRNAQAVVNTKQNAKAFGPKIESVSKPENRCTYLAEAHTVTPVSKLSGVKSMDTTNCQQHRPNVSPEQLKRYDQHSEPRVRPGSCMCYEAKLGEADGPLESTIVSPDRPLLWTLRPISPITKRDGNCTLDDNSFTALYQDKSLQTSLVGVVSAACDSDCDCDSLRRLVITFVVLLIAVLSSGFTQMDPSARVRSAPSRWPITYNSFIASLTADDLVEEFLENVAFD